MNNSSNKSREQRLRDIILDNVAKRVNGKKASDKTQESRFLVITAFFRDLWKAGYTVEPENLTQKHIKIIMAEWERRKLGPATLQKNITHLRRYCQWIGKPNLVNEDASVYFSDPILLKRDYATHTDKSWNNKAHIDKTQLIGLIREEDRYVAMQLKAMDAFGLRANEAICLRPKLALTGDHLLITEGTKGGKPRVIPIRTQHQRDTIQELIQFVDKTTRPLGNPDKSLEQNYRRFYHVLNKFGIKKHGKHALGIVSHGLRHGYALNTLEQLGIKAAVRGGEIGQLDPESEKTARMKLSQYLGHHRVRVTTAYTGPATKHGVTMLTNVILEKLMYSLSTMEIGKEYLFETRPMHKGSDVAPEAFVFEGRFQGVSENEGVFYVNIKLLDTGEQLALIADALIAVSPRR